jgi:hypothetical protein
MLRHFGETPKCPRESRECHMNPLATDTASSAGKRQLSLATVVSKSAGFGLSAERPPG